MNKLWHLCLWLIFLSSPVLAQNSQWVEWIGDVEVSYGQNNNLNLSAFDDDEEDDSLVRVAGVFGRFYQINGTTRMNRSDIRSLDSRSRTRR